MFSYRPVEEEALDLVSAEEADVQELWYTYSGGGE